MTAPDDVVLGDELPDNEWACTRCGQPAALDRSLCDECADELQGGARSSTTSSTPAASRASE